MSGNPREHPAAWDGPEKKKREGWGSHQETGSSQAFIVEHTEDMVRTRTRRGQIFGDSRSILSIELCCARIPYVLDMDIISKTHSPAVYLPRRSFVSEQMQEPGGGIRRGRCAAGDDVVPTSHGQCGLAPGAVLPSALAGLDQGPPQPTPGPMPGPTTARSSPRLLPRSGIGASTPPCRNPQAGKCMPVAKQKRGPRPPCPVPATAPALHFHLVCHSATPPPTAAAGPASPCTAHRTPHTALRTPRSALRTPSCYRPTHTHTHTPTSTRTHTHARARTPPGRWPRRRGTGPPCGPRRRRSEVAR